MRFPYASRDVDPLPGEEGSQAVHEPIILMRFIGPARSYLIEALVDTGASMTLLPRSYMARLGIDPGPAGQLRTAGGGLAVRVGALDLEIRRGRSAYRWSARVGFVPRVDNTAILGHDGFLEHFRATFDGRARTVTLKALGAFPPASIDEWMPAPGGS